MPWLEDLKFPRGYQMGTHIIKFCGLELAESQILKLILQYYNEFKKEKIWQ